MKKNKYYIGSPAGVVFCVDQHTADQITGRIYHAYSRQGVPVASLDELLFSMECFFDRLGFPFPGTNQRMFRKRSEEPIKKERMIRVMKEEELLSRHGDIGTFIIRVQHRQNSSWQGLVTWTEGEETVPFRSVLELIKMIDGAVEKSQEEE